MPTLNPDKDLGHIFAEARRHPFLRAEEEHDLICRWRDARDEDAAARLIGSHLRLVIKIARGFSGYGLPLADLVAEGNVGMMRALEKFDPDRGFRLSTYAAWWVRAAIQTYVLNSWSLVKTGTTTSQKKLFFNLRKMKQELQSVEEFDLTSEAADAIAEALGVTAEDVYDMDGRLGGRDHSLDAPLRDGDGDSASWADLLKEPRDSQEATTIEHDERTWRRGILDAGLSKLSPRERDIVTSRRLRDNPPTLEDLSQKYAVSRERIRQIEARAVEKLTATARAMRHNAASVLAAPAA